MQQYVPLRRAGTRYVGCCPFHKENTASFGVHADGYWKCFGCQAGGDAVDFIRRIEAVSFSAAVRLLADRAGIQVDEEPATETRQQRRLAIEQRERCAWWWNRMVGRLETQQADSYSRALEADDEAGAEVGLEFSDSLASILARISGLANDRGPPLSTDEMWNLWLQLETWQDREEFREEKATWERLEQALRAPRESWRQRA